ncbi:2-oxo-4-hydroxy-4-carboxy-5-ureidoimidazoline decarboxylase-like isoform X2 [Galleria mellonella]|uniref:2-oxo-4-hydroxy-4-carboxy-5-ureidoimidazoline decarboxylase n=1 Tax=Galleria mellonella TaxID=7137 RepID=A0ABM3N450_GALME|nr:2-oxo-4-hydroxy-4-carboxy-5-ureidoimidazoline decarboxylase-like isoform X2 [Galleria mellonella]
MALSISEVNALDDAQFEAIFGNVIELCSDAAVQISKKKPFKNLADLCKAFDQYLDGLSKAEKLVVLRLHPDLAGRLASQGELTRESTAEQRSAGLLDLTEEQKSIINTSNEAVKRQISKLYLYYKKESYVQFIIWVQENLFVNVLKNRKSLTVASQYTYMKT